MKMSVNYDEVACAVVCCTSRDRNIFIQWIYIASQKMPESERYLRWLAWFRTVARRIGKHIWLLLQCHSHPALNKYAMMRWSTSIRNSRNFIRCLMFLFFLSLSLYRNATIFHHSLRSSSSIEPSESSRCCGTRCSIRLHLYQSFAYSLYILYIVFCLYARLWW